MQANVFVGAGALAVGLALTASSDAAQPTAAAPLHRLAAHREPGEDGCGARSAHRTHPRGHDAGREDRPDDAARDQGDHAGRSAPLPHRLGVERRWLLAVDEQARERRRIGCRLAEQYHDASMRADAKTPIPVIWGTDAVHGHSNVFGATLFPHNIGLGAAHEPALMERIGQATAQATRATGIDWVFAPTLAVAQDVRWGRSYESFSSDPARRPRVRRRLHPRSPGRSARRRHGGRDREALHRRWRDRPGPRPGQRHHSRCAK